MKKIIFIAFALILLNACENPLQNKSNNTPKVEANIEIQKQLVKEIMVVHDEVMPMMNSIEEMQKQLRNELAKTKDNALKERILSSLSELENADKAMYEWMDNYKAEPEASIATQYFTEEKTRVNVMAEKVKKAISNAENLILKLKN